MTELRQQRCFRHDQREASGRCPSCRRYYCRECITEHDHRLLCVTCLAQLSATPTPSPRRPWRFDYLYPALGLLMVFTLFYWLGQILILATTEIQGVE